MGATVTATNKPDVATRGGARPSLDEIEARVAAYRASRVLGSRFMDHAAVAAVLAMNSRRPIPCVRPDIWSDFGWFMIVS